MWMSVIFINEGCEALTYCFHISIVSLLFSVIIMTYLCSLNCSSTIEIDWFAWTGPENCWWFNGKIMNCMMPLSFPKSTFQPYTFSTCFIRHSGWKGNIDWFSYFSCRLVICFVILLARLVNMLSTMMPYCWLLCLLVRRLKFLPLELWRPRRSMIQTVSTLNFSSSRPLHYILKYCGCRYYIWIKLLDFQYNAVTKKFTYFPVYRHQDGRNYQQNWPGGREPKSACSSSGSSFKSGTSKNNWYSMGCTYWSICRNCISAVWR